MGKTRPRLNPAGRAGDAGDWPFKRMYHTPKSNNQHTSTEEEYTYTFRVRTQPLHFHSVGHYGVIVAASLTGQLSHSEERVWSNSGMDKLRVRVISQNLHQPFSQRLHRESKPVALHRSGTRKVAHEPGARAFRYTIMHSRSKFTKMSCLNGFRCRRLVF